MDGEGDLRDLRCGEVGTQTVVQGSCYTVHDDERITSVDLVVGVSGGITSDGVI